jgi:general secretion pathway protein C
MLSLALPQSTVQNWLRPERSRQVARVVNVLLVLWLAWLLAGLSWLVMPDTGQDDTAPVTAPVKMPVQRERPRISEQQVASWHLFGVAGEDKPAPKVAAVDAPDTSLKLTLRGVFASDEAGEARAIVGDQRGDEKHYSVGDPLPGNATLSEIYPDRIILERNGRYETLRLPKEQMPGNSSARGARSTRASSAVTGGGAGASASAFQKYRQEVKRNPSAFLTYVRTTPERGKDGKFIGFRLQAGRKPEALGELGLKQGDIVTAVNGVQIDSPAKGMKAMQALGEGENVNVTLLRDGQETSISLTVPSDR